MTRTLERAVTKAAKLPEAVQDQLAKQLLEDIEGEMRWDATLAKSQKTLERLAEKARQAKRDGRTRSKGFG